MIKLPKRTQKRITKTKFVPVQSTFVTKDGPAIGTVWFDRAFPSRPPIRVTKVECVGACWLASMIDFESGEKTTVKRFLQRVEEGRYVLIGVKPLAISHIETGR